MERAAMQKPKCECPDKFCPEHFAQRCCSVDAAVTEPHNNLVLCLECAGWQASAVQLTTNTTKPKGKNRERIQIHAQQI
jgi:hypothetical protein